MKEPDASLEDCMRPIPMISVLPMFAAFAWTAISGVTNKVLISGAMLIFFAGSFYSQISTGWAHDPTFRASWCRGSDYDAIYWLNVAITFAAMLIGGWVFVGLLLTA